MASYSKHDDHGGRATEPECPSTPVSQPKRKLEGHSTSLDSTDYDEDLFSSPSSSFSNSTTWSPSSHCPDDAKAPFSNNNDSSIVQIYSRPQPKYYDATLISTITPASCLQCSLLRMPCDTRQPTCGRCARHHEQSYYGWHGMIEHIQPCLAQRKRTIEELRMGVYPGEVDILFRLEEDGEGTWERKLELANELLEKDRREQEMKNWALPMAGQRLNAVLGTAAELFGPAL